MTLLLIGLAALGSPSPSIHETHERIWHPAGKTPAFTFRMRRQPSCANTRANHHQAGKAPLPARKRCESRVR